jgi:hypothetical protein
VPVPVTECVWLNTNVVLHRSLRSLFQPHLVLFYLIVLGMSTVMSCDVPRDSTAAQPALGGIGLGGA